MNLVYVSWRHESRKSTVTSYAGVERATVSLTEELIMNFAIIISPDFIVIFHYSPTGTIESYNIVRGLYCCMSGSKCTVLV